jgi:hypothetical protein
MAWKRLVRRSKLVDFHFHDFRHEAISRLFERGLTIPEVALVSGHKDPRMLFRYTHIKPEDVASKLWAGSETSSEPPPEQCLDAIEKTSRRKPSLMLVRNSVAATG